jgi:hypothetical protein
MTFRDYDEPPSPAELRAAELLVARAWPERPERPERDLERELSLAAVEEFALWCRVLWAVLCVLATVVVFGFAVGGWGWR